MTKTKYESQSPCANCGGLHWGSYKCPYTLEEGRAWRGNDRPGFSLIACPHCGQESYVNHKILDGPPELNINRCLRCAAEVTLVSIDPLRIELVRIT